MVFTLHFSNLFLDFFGPWPFCCNCSSTRCCSSTISHNSSIVTRSSAVMSLIWCVDCFGNVFGRAPPCLSRDDSGVVSFDISTLAMALLSSHISLINEAFSNDPFRVSLCDFNSCNDRSVWTAPISVWVSATRVLSVSDSRSSRISSSWLCSDTVRGRDAVSVRPVRGLPSPLHSIFRN